MSKPYCAVCHGEGIIRTGLDYAPTTICVPCGGGGLDDPDSDGLILDPLSVNEAWRPISAVLQGLAAQENCDGAPYDQMVAAADYIDKLKAALADRESRIAALTEANERLEAHADRMAHSHIPKNAKVYELESRIAALEGERERERAKLAASEARVKMLAKELHEAATCLETESEGNRNLVAEYRAIADDALSPVASHDAATGASHE